jgi:hypothetical protein
MSEAIGSYSVEERVIQGETVWVAIRARGAEWSWLTPAEAARLGRQWVERYANQRDRGPPRTAPVPALRTKTYPASSHWD